MDDLEFVRRCASQDKQAWDEFVDKYSRLVHNYIHAVLADRNYLASKEIINDLYQEVFLHLIKDDFKKLRQFKGKSGCSLASWLRIITINLTLDFLRRQKPDISLDEEPQDSAQALIGFLPDERNTEPADILSSQERFKNLYECINDLNSSDKYFVEMHIYRNVNLEYIRKTLNISRSAVDMRKSRIIERLKNCFKKKGFVLEI